MATPHVAGLAALLMSMRKGLSPEDVKDLIEENVQKKPQYKDKVSSGGLLDVYASIEALIDRKPDEEKPVEMSEFPSCEAEAVLAENSGQLNKVSNQTCIDRCSCESPKKGWSSSSQRCKKGKSKISIIVIFHQVSVATWINGIDL